MITQGNILKGAGLDKSFLTSGVTLSGEITNFVIDGFHIKGKGTCGDHVICKGVGSI